MSVRQSLPVLELDIADAEIAAEEAHQNREHDAVELAEALAKGIQGSDAVVAARERQVEADRKVGEEERKLADTIEEASKLGQEAMRQLEQAHRDVRGAQQGVVDAGVGLQQSQRQVRDLATEEADALQSVRDRLAGLVTDFGLAPGLIAPHIEEMNRLIASLNPNVDLTPTAALNKGPNQYAHPIGPPAPGPALPDNNPLLTGRVPGSGLTINTNVYNAVPEPASVSVGREVRKKVYLYGN